VKHDIDCLETIEGMTHGRCQCGYTTDSYFDPNNAAKELRDHVAATADEGGSVDNMESAPAGESESAPVTSTDPQTTSNNILT
jgi:hypothetical protein